MFLLGKITFWVEYLKVRFIFKNLRITNVRLINMLMDYISY